ncbi:MAG TPA: hypothetical protein VFE77_06885 [Rhodanobacter sp.]|nr:hypothetical protein [Rhodanobacter sp.]
MPSGIAAAGAADRIIPDTGNGAVFLPLYRSGAIPRQAAIEAPRWLATRGQAEDYHHEAYVDQRDSA